MRIHESNNIWNYLGLSISGKRLSSVDYSGLKTYSGKDQKVRNGKHSLLWEESHMLTKSVFSTLPIYLMSNCTIPMKVLLQPKGIMRNFSLGSSIASRMVNLLCWDCVCQLIRAGSLGLTSLVAQSDVLMAKQIGRAHV